MDKWMETLGIKETVFPNQYCQIHEIGALFGLVKLKLNIAEGEEGTAAIFSELKN